MNTQNDLRNEVVDALIALEQFRFQVGTRPINSWELDALQAKVNDLQAGILHMRTYQDHAVNSIAYQTVSEEESSDSDSEYAPLGIKLNF